MRSSFLIILFSLFAFLGSSAFAGNLFFDVAQRKAQLQQPSHAAIKQACLYKDARFLKKMPKPVSGLKSTKGYGSDQAAANFAWATMVLSGRALAGDDAASKQLQKLYLNWAKAGALLKSDEAHDTYYALKRNMLPAIISFSVIADEMNAKDKQRVTQWLDKVARPLGKKFGGDVDFNNHRYLADSVLLAWGAYSGDNALYAQGIAGYKRAIDDANADGSWDLETRRGTRATWYIRHGLASLVSMAEIAKLKGDDLFSYTSPKGVNLETVMNYFLNSHYASANIFAKSAENYIPGPSYEYLTQDRGYFDTRGHDRHYMAFVEAYALQSNFAAKRLGLLMSKFATERPLLDEYFGGNATCFFAQGENK